MLTERNERCSFSRGKKYQLPIIGTMVFTEIFSFIYFCFFFAVAVANVGHGLCEGSLVTVSHN